MRRMAPVCPRTANAAAQGSMPGRCSPRALVAPENGSCRRPGSRRSLFENLANGRRIPMKIELRTGGQDLGQADVTTLGAES